MLLPAFLHLASNKKLKNKKKTLKTQGKNVKIAKYERTQLIKVYA